MRVENFDTRSAMIEETHENFLRLLVSLGGYCTVTQAEELKLADNNRRTRAHLKRLEVLGFLRRVAAYPVVYQITKSATRHLERDSGARRRHTLSTIQTRLLAVDFYLAARKWPAKFILDHEQKVAAFLNRGCPVEILPQHGGEPYLREEFLLSLSNGRLGIAAIDQPHRAARTQMLGLIGRFTPAIRSMGEAAVELLIVTGWERRYYVYRRILQHPKVQAAWPSEFEFAVRAYCVPRPTQPVAGLVCPTCNRPQFQSETSRDHNQNHPNKSLGSAPHVLANQKRSTDPMIPIHCDLA
jgi:hypothetical protein